MAVSSGKVIGIGASLIDLNFNCYQTPVLNTSNPATFHKSSGGVVRNIIHTLALLQAETALISALGNDSDGNWLIDEMIVCGVDTSACLRHERETGTFVSLNDPEGHLFIGAVSEGIEDLLNISYLSQHREFLKTAALLLADGNLAASTLKWLIEFSETENIPIVLETVSLAKTKRINECLPGKILLTKPNQDELEIFGNESDAFYSSDERIPWLHTQGLRYVWLSLGAEGSLFSDGHQLFRSPAMRVNIKDSLGAGDAAMAGWIWAYLKGYSLQDCVHYGHTVAGIVLEHPGAIAYDINPDLLEKKYRDYLAQLR